MGRALSDRLLLAQSKFAGLRAGPPPLTDREAFIEALILVSAADEDIVGEEMETLALVVGRHEAFSDMEEEAVSELVSRALKRVLTEDAHARARAISVALRNDDARRLTFRWACAVALADGEIPEAELRVLKLLQKEFRLSDKEVEKSFSEATGPRD